MVDGGATTAGSQAATALRDEVLPRASVAGLSRRRSTRIRQSGIEFGHFKGPGGPTVGVDGGRGGRFAWRVRTFLDDLRRRLVLERWRGHAVVILIMVKRRRMGRHGRSGISGHASLEGFSIIIGRRSRIVVHHGHTTTAAIHGRPASLRVFPRARHGTLPTVFRRRRTVVRQRIVWRLLSIHRRTKRRRVGIG